MKIQTFFMLALALVGVELLSYFSWRYPVLGVFSWVVITGLIFWTALVRPDIALGAVMAELVLGGKGYLLTLPIGNADISIRMGIFLAVLTAWALTALRNRSFWGTQQSFRWFWLGIIGIAVWATLVGMLRGHAPGDIFDDANAFLFLGLAPAFGLLRTRDQLLHIFYWMGASVVVLALETGMTQGLYAHLPSTSLTLLYKWIRETGVGEVTYIIGHLYRVFFQSHIYGLFGFFVGVGLALAQPKRRWLWTAVAASGAFVVVVSLSRSFWLGGLAAAGIGLFALIARRSFRIYLGRATFFSALALLTAYVGFIWSINFPGLWGGGGGGGAGALIQSRSDVQTESAASSRRELLPVITHAFFDHPFTGSGFGTALTFKSKDPRVNATKQPGGTLYTTTAFELGYHGFALQFGLPLVILFLLFVGYILKRGGTLLRFESSDQPLVAGIWLALFALCVLHLTTPYLNHPLGFGFLFVGAASFVLLDPRYAKR